MGIMGVSWRCRTFPARSSVMRSMMELSCGEKTNHSNQWSSKEFIYTLGCLRSVNVSKQKVYKNHVYIYIYSLWWMQLRGCCKENVVKSYWTEHMSRVELLSVGFQLFITRSTPYIRSQVLGLQEATEHHGAHAGCQSSLAKWAKARFSVLLGKKHALWQDTRVFKGTRTETTQLKMPVALWPPSFLFS